MKKPGVNRESDLLYSTQTKALDSLNRVRSLAALDPNEVKSFFENSVLLIDEVQALIRSCDLGCVVTFEKAFRNLHTLKGNAHTFILENIAIAVHAVESRVTDALCAVQNGKAVRDVLIQEIEQGLYKVLQALDSYIEACRILNITLPFHCTVLRSVFVNTIHLDVFLSACLLNVKVDPKSLVKELGVRLPVEENYRKIGYLVQNLIQSIKVLDHEQLMKFISQIEINWSVKGKLNASVEDVAQFLKGFKDYKQFLFKYFSKHISNSIFRKPQEFAKISKAIYTLCVCLKQEKNEFWENSFKQVEMIRSRCNQNDFDYLENLFNCIKKDSFESLENVLCVIWNYLLLVFNVHYNTLKKEKKIYFTEILNSRIDDCSKCGIDSGYVCSLLCELINADVAPEKYFKVMQNYTNFEWERILNSEDSLFDKELVKWCETIGFSLHPMHLDLKEPIPDLFKWMQMALPYSSFLVKKEIYSLIAYGIDEREMLCTFEKKKTIEVLETTFYKMKQTFVDLKRQGHFDDSVQRLFVLFNLFLDLDVKSSLKRYELVVEDLANRLSKKVRFVVRGDDVVLSKTNLDLLHAIIDHIIRNAVDHGIESAELRKQMGKKEEGVLEIYFKAKKEGFDMIIKDDGAGIDLDCLYQKAVDHRVALLGEVSELSDSDLLDLIFVPGLSTKDDADFLSGRGVGLDVVKNAVNQIGGNITVLSEKGKGVEFMFRLRPHSHVDRYF